MCLGSALLPQLGHVDGVAAFAEPQRLAFRGEDFASAFGAHADDPTRAWHAVDDPFDSLACPGEALHVPSGVRRPAQEGQDDWRSFCEPLPPAEPCSRVRACLFDGLLGLVEQVDGVQVDGCGRVASLRPASVAGLRETVFSARDRLEPVEVDAQPVQEPRVPAPARLAQRP